MLTVEYVSDFTLEKANPTDAGADLKASETVVFKPGDRKLVSTGTFLKIQGEGFVPVLPGMQKVNNVFAYGGGIVERTEIPWGTVIDVRGRSSMALKGFDTHYGTVDDTYHNEVKVVMCYNPPETRSTWKQVINKLFLGLVYNKPEYVIKQGDKIAQLVPLHFPQVEYKKIEQITEESRGGFGSSGV